MLRQSQSRKITNGTRCAISHKRPSNRNQTKKVDAHMIDKLYHKYVCETEFSSCPGRKFRPFCRISLSEAVMRCSYQLRSESRLRMTVTATTSAAPSLALLTAACTDPAQRRPRSADGAHLSGAKRATTKNMVRVKKPCMSVVALWVR